MGLCLMPHKKAHLTGGKVLLFSLDAAIGARSAAHPLDAGFSRPYTNIIQLF